MAIVILYDVRRARDERAFLRIIDFLFFTSAFTLNGSVRHFRCGFLSLCTHDSTRIASCPYPFQSSISLFDYIINNKFNIASKVTIEVVYREEERERETKKESE